MSAIVSFTVVWIRTGEPLDLLAELLDVLKTAVYGGKAHIGHFIKLAQLGHDRFSHFTGRQFTFAGGAQTLLDTGNTGFDFFDADRTLFQRTLDTGAQLVFIKRLARAIALDDARHQQFGGFIGGKTLMATDAFTPTPDLLTFSHQP